MEAQVNEETPAEWPPKLDDNVPLSEGSRLKDRWLFIQDMKPKQSFLVKTKDLASTACKYGRKKGFKMAYSQVDNGFRVWRMQ